VLSVDNSRTTNRRDRPNLVVNRGLAPPEQAPKTWQDLANPLYKGKIILFDPSISGPGCNLFHFLTDVYGEQRLWKTYPKAATATVRNVSLDVADGEIVTLL
jgi:ABC-type Fe3+ transport system substrate-binding protein